MARSAPVRGAPRLAVPTSAAFSKSRSQARAFKGKRLRRAGGNPLAPLGALDILACSYSATWKAIGRDLVAFSSVDGTSTIATHT
jgi:hypothetical protein